MRSSSFDQLLATSDSVSAISQKHLAIVLILSDCNTESFAGLSSHVAHKDRFDQHFGGNNTPRSTVISSVLRANAVCRDNQLQNLIMNYDVNRHREIIVKAISGLLLLLLKHFKLNHIYQFEYLSQHLVSVNCIPLVLKFFNQNTLLYVQAKNRYCLA